MAGVIGGFNNVLGSQFADNFDELKAKDQLLKTLIIKGNNLLEPITIQCYLDTVNGNPFVIRSSQNQAFFSSDSTGIYDRLFKNWNEFLTSTNGD